MATAHHIHSGGARRQGLHLEGCYLPHSGKVTPFLRDLSRDLACRFEMLHELLNEEIELIPANANSAPPKGKVLSPGAFH